LFSYPANGGEAFHYQPTQDLLSAAIGDGRSFGIVDVATGQQIFSVTHAARPPAPLGYADWAAVSPTAKPPTPPTISPSSPGTSRCLSDESRTGSSLGSRLAVWCPSKTARGCLRSVSASKSGTSPRANWKKIQRLDALGLHSSSESVSPEKRRRMIGNFRAGSSLIGIVASADVAETFDLTTGRSGLALGRNGAEIMTEFQSLVSKTNVTREEILRQGAQLRAEVFPRGDGSDGPLSMDASPDGKWLLIADPQSRDHPASLWSLETGRLVRVLGARNDGPHHGWRVCWSEVASP